MCGIPDDGNLAGLLFVSSGLGGMSGAQPKAAEIAGAVSIVAEVDRSRIVTRHRQGWVGIISDDIEEAFEAARRAQDDKRPLSIAYHGNVVDLLAFAARNRIPIDLLSDQTSCHVAYDGGYCPQGVSFEERTRLLQSDRTEFKRRVDDSLRRHFEWIRELTDQGAYFFDYGNAFLKAVFDAGVREAAKNGVNDKDGFVFPSYFEDLMGPVFDYGYGPFRWVCLSGKPEDLRATDQAARECIDPNRRPEDRDNWIWMRDAEKNRLVVGSQARILYQDAAGRVRIALKFNELVRNAEVGPIMLGRDHHDPGGTDSPFRETANIRDGSNVTADMATHCFAGNAARGMSLVALHNGGGTGIEKAVNGGFGLVLDGSARTDRIIRSAMSWDVMGGVARRNWARNPNAMSVALEHNTGNPDGDQITLPYLADDAAVDEAVDAALKGSQ
jgi:urocanate hydratase